MSLFTVPPCRVIDTRWAVGPLGGPELAAGIDRAFALANQCGIPPTARALAFNAAVTGATTPGFLVLYAAGTDRPPTSILNYRAHQTRAKNGIAGLGTSGGLAAFAGQSSGTVNLILDVTGYFQ
jgi:hypothetical protein